MLRAARNRTEPLLCEFREARSISDTSRLNESWEEGWGRDGRRDGARDGRRDGVRDGVRVIWEGWEEGWEGPGLPQKSSAVPECSSLALLGQWSCVTGPSGQPPSEGAEE